MLQKTEWCGFLPHPEIPLTSERIRMACEDDIVQFVKDNSNLKHKENLHLHIINIDNQENKKPLALKVIKSKKHVSRNCVIYY